MIVRQKEAFFQKLGEITISKILRIHHRNLKGKGFLTPFLDDLL
jgi:hypothetical protein